MKIFALIIVSVLAHLLFSSWWVAIPVGALIGVSIPRPGRAFFTAFSVVFLIWLAGSIFVDLQSNGMLSLRLSGLFSLPTPWLALALVGLTGGLCGGFVALTSSLLRRTLEVSFIPAPKESTEPTPPERKVSTSP